MAEVNKKTDVEIKAKTDAKEISRKGLIVDEEIRTARKKIHGGGGLDSEEIDDNELENQEQKGFDKNSVS